ncbi:nuclear transport factor 2 family protein [Nonomuraea wenchangensis]
MTSADAFVPYSASALPDVVVAYLDAHDDKRHADASATFAPDATVLDDGKTYEGIDAIRAWIQRSSHEYTYTSTRLGQHLPDDAHAIVLVRLDGNFPGGTVTLRYRFEHDGTLITRLTIAAS